MFKAQSVLEATWFNTKELDETIPIYMERGARVKVFGIAAKGG